MKKILIICIVVALIAAAAVICALSIRSDKPQAQAVSASEIRVTDGDASRGQFISMCMYLYEQLSGEAVPVRETNGANGSESVKKAYALGIIDDNDAAVYSDSGALTREEAAVLLYTTMVKYDAGTVMELDDINSVLNGCYDNMSLTYRDACAFVIQSGAAADKCSFYPSRLITSEEAADWINVVYSLYKKEHSVSFENGKTIFCGDTEVSLVKALGQPQRTDVSFYGGKTYIYDTPSLYAAVYVDRGVVRGFFSNLGIKDSTDMFGEIKNGGGAYYRADSKRAAKSTAVMRETEQRELFDMLAAYRRSRGLGAFYEHSSLVMLGEENSRSVSDGGKDMDIPEKRAVVRGQSAEDMYIQLVTSAKYKGALDTAGARVCYAAVGLWYGSVEPCATVLIDDVTRVSDDDKSKTSPIPVQTAEPVYTNKAPVMVSPVNEEKVSGGVPLVIQLEERVSESFIARVADTETGETVVYARIYGDSLAVDPSVFKEGMDYAVTVSADGSGEELFAETAAVRCGEPEKPKIISPQVSETIDTDSINITWKSRYSDFSVTLYNESGENLGSQRTANKNEVQIGGLSDGLYTVEVTAYRKDTNVVMASQSVKFLVQLASVNITRTERPAISFGETKYSAVFGGAVLYSSKAEADRNMTTVKVPVWQLNGAGEKVASSMSVTVNKAIAQQVREIFEEIYNGSERFPIKSLGGYNWRSTATGTRSQHSYGTCIDINADENYCIYNSGRVIGKFWKPGENPYSITPDGDVVRAFKSRGWTWGAEWSSLKDYMHFSYLGG